MDHTTLIAVVDDKAAPVTGARVCLVEKSTIGTELHPFPSAATTHAHAASGNYKASPKIALSDDDWLLVVTLTGKAPVVQPLAIKQDKKGEFKVTPKPAAVATVTITNTIREVAGVKVKEIAFHVKLFPAAEIAYLSGLDYHQIDVSAGWLFHEYAFDRAEALRRDKKIHDGTIVTVFSTPKIWRKTRVWGGTKWVDIEVAQLGDPKSRKLGTTHDSYTPVSPPDIHITDFYKHLDSVGNREPKSVIEIGIYSHSYPGGPILYNTGEASSRKPDTAWRDPKDFDARPKDFNVLNTRGYSKMKDSFAANCRFTVWGCSATTHIKFSARRSLQAINAGKAADDFFTVTSEYFDTDNTSVVTSFLEEHTSELRFRFEMDQAFRGGGYASEAAKKLGIEVRAGCPGTGSDPDRIAGLQVLKVNLNTYKDVFSYFHKQFGPEFAETNGKWDQGYVDYHALQSRAPVAKPSFSTEYYKLWVQTKVTRWQNVVGAALLFDKPGAKLVHSTPNVRVVVKPINGQFVAGKKGHLFILQDKNDFKSQAAYVQEDQDIFKIERDKSNNWTVKGVLI